MIYILFFNWKNIEKSFSKPKPIISKVTLKNECTIISEAFIVIHVKSKRFASFSNGLARLKLNEGDAAEDATGGNNYFNSTAPSSTLITLGNAVGVNASSQDYICYAFADKTGYSKFGSYTGNGNADGTFIYTGFKPSFLMIKRTNSNVQWIMYDNKRNPFNAADNRIYANTTSAEVINSAYDIDFLSNGFKTRGTNSLMNHDGSPYIFMAFAEAPLVGSNNVPCTAR